MVTVCYNSIRPDRATREPLNSPFLTRRPLFQVDFVGWVPVSGGVLSRNLKVSIKGQNSAKKLWLVIIPSD